MDRRIKIIFIVLGTLAFAVVAALMVALDMFPLGSSRNIAVSPSATPDILPSSTGIGSAANSSSIFSNASSAISGNMSEAADSEPIAASSLTEIDANKDFSIPDLPDLQFHINKVYKAAGGVNSEACGAVYGKNSQYMLIKNRPGMALPGSISDGYCFMAPNNPIAGEAASALVVVDLEIKNGGDGREDGKFLHLLYTPNGSEDTQVAGEVPNWLEYGAAPGSTDDVLIGFEIPLEQTEVELVYGNYSSVSAKYWNAEDVFGKTVSGFTVNFDKKTIEEIQG